jgi:hypothetical protein
MQLHSPWQRTENLSVRVGGGGGGGGGGIRRTDMTATSMNYVHIFQSATHLTIRYNLRHSNDTQFHITDCALSVE